jgi:hypothetical protein
LISKPLSEDAPTYPISSSAPAPKPSSTSSPQTHNVLQVSSNKPSSATNGGHESLSSLQILPPTTQQSAVIDGASSSPPTREDARTSLLEHPPAPHPSSSSAPTSANNSVGSSSPPTVASSVPADPKTSVGSSSPPTTTETLPTTADSEPLPTAPSISSTTFPGTASATGAVSAVSSSASARLAIRVPPRLFLSSTHKNDSPSSNRAASPSKGEIASGLQLTNHFPITTRTSAITPIPITTPAAANGVSREIQKSISHANVPRPVITNGMPESETSHEEPSQNSISHVVDATSHVAHTSPGHEQSCSFRLSTSAAWAHEASVLASSDSSNEEPLKVTRKRHHDAEAATSSPFSRAIKRRRIPHASNGIESVSPDFSSVFLWNPYTKAPANGTPNGEATIPPESASLWRSRYIAAANRASNDLVTVPPEPISLWKPLSAPVMGAWNDTLGGSLLASPEVASFTTQRQHQPPFTEPRQSPFTGLHQPPFAEPLPLPSRQPLPGIQQRAQRLAAVHVADARSASEYDSEEEVEHYLRRPHRIRSTSRLASRTSPEESSSRFTFLSQQQLFADSVVVMVEDVLYHLPRSRLVQISEYFARHLSKSSDNELEQSAQLDRCAVMKVTGVCAADFEALLEVCDDIGFVVIAT